MNGDQAFLFGVALKKAVWNILIRVFFNFFLEFFLRGIPIYRPCFLKSYLRGF